MSRDEFCDKPVVDLTGRAVWMETGLQNLRFTLFCRDTTWSDILRVKLAGNRQLAREARKRPQTHYHFDDKETLPGRGRRDTLATERAWCRASPSRGKGTNAQ